MDLILVFSELQVLLSHLWEKEKEKKRKREERKRNRKGKEGRRNKKRLEETKEEGIKKN